MRDSYIYFLVILLFGTISAEAEQGIAFYEVTKDTESAKPFAFERVQTGETVKGYYRPEPVLDLSGLNGVWPSAQEIGTIPMTGLIITFKANAIRSLEAVNREGSEVLIIFHGQPLAKIGTAELIGIASRGEKLFVVASSYPADELVKMIKAINGEISRLRR